MDRFIIDVPAVENISVGGVELEIHQLTHMRCQPLVVANHIIAARLAETPVGILHCVGLKNVVSSVESCLQLVGGIVIIRIDAVALYRLVEEIVAACKRKRTCCQGHGRHNAESLAC